MGTNGVWMVRFAKQLGPLFVLSFVLAASLACARANGLTGDVVGLLSDRGVKIEVLTTEAPLSSRSGVLTLRPTFQLAEKIVSALELKLIDPKDSRFRAVSGRAPGQPKALWGVSGRPQQLKLNDGAQLEYLYLLTTQEGEAYIIAEYAYG